MPNATYSSTLESEDDPCVAAKYFFKWDHKEGLWLWVPVFLLAIGLCLYVFVSYGRNPSRRKVPAKLMMARTFADLLFLIIFFTMILYNARDTCYNCSWLTPLLLIPLLVSESYFGAISYDIYRTLTNPFRTPLSDSLRIHVPCWIGCIVIVSLCSVHGIGWWDFRPDLGICLTEYSGANEINIPNWFLLYVPALVACVAGLSITFWAKSKLEKKVLDTTFELRWTVLRRQFTITVIYSFGYFAILCLWLPIGIVTYFNTFEDRPTFQPYCLMAVAVVQCVADAAAWYFMEVATQKQMEDNDKFLQRFLGIPVSTRKSQKKKKKSDDNVTDSSALIHNAHASPAEQAQARALEKQRLKKQTKTQDLSNALRREVVAYMTSGIAYACRQTAAETYQAMTAEDDEPFGWGGTGTNATMRRSHTSRLSQVSRASQVSEMSNLAVNSSLQSKNTTSINDNEHDKKPTLTVYGQQHINSDDYEYADDATGDPDDAYASAQFMQKGSYVDGSPNLSPNPSQRNLVSELDTPERPPPQVYYAQSLNQNPEQLKGTLNRYPITIDNGEDKRRHETFDESAPDEIPFTDYSPHVFRYLRQQIYGVSDQSYLDSVSPVNDEYKESDIVAKFSEGRSGAFFFYTYDMKYLIKTLTYDEASLLLSILADYTDHMEKNRKETSNTSFLNKFLGLHSIKLYKIIYFVVIENVFVGNKEPHEKYDLKGSWIDRHTNHHVDSGKLMKDEDLHKTLMLDHRVSDRIFQQLYEDSKFLESVGIMDYSLLLGIYYVGIDPEKVQPTNEDALGFDDEEKRKSERDAGIWNGDDKNSDDADENENENGDDFGHNYDDILSVGTQDRFPPELDSVHLNNAPEWKRRRAETFFTQMRNVGNSEKAVQAKMIEGPGIYYLGMIDMLQKWNTSKRLERLFKVYLRCKDPYGISCVEPTFYRKRFLHQMIKLGIKPLKEHQHLRND